MFTKKYKKFQVLKFMFFLNCDDEKDLFTLAKLPIF